MRFIPLRLLSFRSHSVSHPIWSPSNHLFLSLPLPHSVLFGPSFVFCYSTFLSCSISSCLSLTPLLLSHLLLLSIFFPFDPSFVFCHSPLFYYHFHLASTPPSTPFSAPPFSSKSLRSFLRFPPFFLHLLFSSTLTLHNLLLLSLLHSVFRLFYLSFVVCHSTFIYYLIPSCLHLTIYSFLFLSLLFSVSLVLLSSSVLFFSFLLPLQLDFTQPYTPISSYTSNSLSL